MSAVTPALRARWVKRACRARKVRARSISAKRFSKSELEASRLEYPETITRPRVRIECEQGPRPCPYVSCKYNLFIDVSPRTGSLKFNFPDLELWEMGESCVLDAAARGGMPLETVAVVLNLTRERVRQLEVMACVAIMQRMRGHR
jgi:hypothetical protein